MTRLLSSSTQLQIRARAQLELRRRGLVGVSPYARYQLDPIGYIRDKLGWQPWAGDADYPGQVEVLDAYAAALRTQIETPGASVQNVLRVEAGHTVGKTRLASGMVNHFFDCFAPSILYTFAPTYEQIHDLLWKEIKATRRGKGLPGRILDLELRQADDHFAKGRATNNVGGQGTERAQGQHGPYLMFVLDEAEGIADYVYDAVQSMTSGGLAIVLLLANPRTRSSRFHRLAAATTTTNFRISCLHHPNVLADREIVPGAVQRRYVETMIDDGQEQHAEVVQAHDPDAHTFELPWRPGIIYRPDHEFLFRVLGIAPANIADNTFVPVGRYDAAKLRQASGVRPDQARIGVDVARYGKDMGSVYVCHGGALWRAAQLAKQDTNAYARAIHDQALSLAARGVTSLHVRIDAGGGYGGGVADRLATDSEIHWAIPDFRVFEVHFNGTPYDPLAYADTATEIYDHTAKALAVLALLGPPNALEADLCERTYRWVKVGGVDVKKLEPKDDFKTRHGRSPDDGDGAALATAPDYVFASARAQAWDKGALGALSGGKKV